MRHALTIALVCSLATFSLAADAGDRHEKKHYRDDGHHAQYARVISSRPIIETRLVSRPQRECWEETTHYENRGHDATAAIIGAVAGGVVGNRFGEGKGKDAMTVAGALLGASIGHDAGRRGGAAYPVTEQRCRVSHERYREEHVTGYRVSYRYHGRVYTTRMPYDPGERIRVQVDVSPDY